MVKWYLATYQNGAFSSDLGIIQPSEDNVYKLKNPIDSGESPEKKDWLRITITDNKVKKWITDNDNNSSWTEDTSLTGLVNGSIYWVYGSIVKYVIVTNSQTYYLESFSNDENGIITGKDINDSDVSIDVTAITAVTIGPSVTTIGYRAFYLCTKLASLTIGNSVTEIGNSAFSQCYSLASVIIPDSVTTIGEYAFDGCSSLASLKIGDSVTTIGEGAFYDCSRLASVNIPKSVTSITDLAFSNINAYAIIIIPEGVLTKLNEADPSPNLFYGNNLLVSGDTILVKPYEYYTIVTNDQTYYLPSFSNGNGKDINNSHVSIDPMTITHVTIGDSVTSIGDSAFSQCSRLVSVTMGDSVTEIGDGAFAGCHYLESVNIPDSVTEIGNSAFAHCTSLMFVIIGNSVTGIGENAFYQCSSLTSLTIGDSVTTIGVGAFSQCYSLASVTIPDSVTQIGEDAFYHCENLASVTIGNSVTTIGNYAFSRCSKLLTLIIPDSVTEIGQYAFDEIGKFSNNDTIITISLNTVRSLTSNNSYTSGKIYLNQTFFSNTTNVILNVI